MASNSARTQAAAAAALYAALTAVFTWPVVRGLAHSIPGDYGDPLLNSWILAWDATHLFVRDHGWWNANIFHPHPLALGYSEHLAAQALQIFPLYLVTGNALLCYNVLFLSTFVLSGLGMFLFVRALTGDVRASLVAGCAYAFAPYRMASLPHIQVLSSAWMPFALLGFRRYFETRRMLPLAGAALAWLLQNLSCGYYLFFFGPVLVGYLVWEITTRHLWTAPRVVAEVGIAAIVVAASTAPYLLPYMELRRMGFSPRSLSETRRFSADVYGYFTADPNMFLWGKVAHPWVQAEGALFPGLTIVALAAIGVARPFQGCGIKRDAKTVARRLGNFRDPKRVALILGVTLMAVTLLALLLGFSIRLPGLKVTSLGRAAIVFLVLGVAMLAASRELRSACGRWLRSPSGCFTLITVLALAMSLGPEIHARGRVVLESGPYNLFYRYVPGFDGLRVPARFAMIAVLGLSVLAGLGTTSRFAPLAAVLILIESFAAPLPMNQNPADYKRAGLAPLPDLPRETPPVYQFVASLPETRAIVELPLGEPAFDVRYMYYSTKHWRPIVNGYTGGQPSEYEFLDLMLQDLFTQPKRAWDALRDSQPTHAIVHESFYEGRRGAAVSAWLQTNGSHEIGLFGHDRIFELPAPASKARR